MWLEPAIELVEHDAGLHHAAPVGDIELDDVVEVFGAIDHQRLVDRLPGLRGAATARQHRDSLLARQRNSAHGVRDSARQDDADRHDLVVRGIGRITAAAEAVEQDLALELSLEPPFESGQYRGHHGTLPIFQKISPPAVPDKAS